MIYVYFLRPIHVYTRHLPPNAMPVAEPFEVPRDLPVCGRCGRELLISLPRIEMAVDFAAVHAANHDDPPESYHVPFAAAVLRAYEAKLAELDPTLGVWFDTAQSSYWFPLTQVYDTLRQCFTHPDVGYPDTLFCRMQWSGADDDPNVCLLSFWAKNTPA